jgi:predicted DNA-binding WGR domain protein
VKNIRAKANPLKPGQVVVGTDSSFKWSAYDFAKGMNEFVESDQVRQTQESMRSYVEELDRQLQEIDWNQLGSGMQRRMEKFSRDLEEALKDEDLQNLRQEVEKSYQEALAALNRVQNSQESQELRESIDHFYRNFQKELSPTATPDQE